MNRKLGDLVPQQLDYICALRLDNHTLQRIADKVRAEFDVSYTNASYSTYFKSQEGKDRLHSMEQLLWEEWENEPLAKKVSRVHALAEQAQKLQRIIRSLPIHDPAYLTLSKEFRGYLALLRVETEPLRVGKEEEIVSPFEWLLKDDGKKQG